MSLPAIGFVTPTLQILLLQLEAVAAGDTAQVVLCDMALGGNSTARSYCFHTIRDAEAIVDAVEREAREILNDGGES